MDITVANCVALDKDTNKVVHISEYNEGQNCICIDCKKKMIKCSENDEHHKVRPYFRHLASTSCKGGSCESYLHHIAKEIFEEITEYDLPSKESVLMNKLVHIESGKHITIDKVSIEEVHRIDEYSYVKPDVTLYYHTEDNENEMIFIEIKNSHAVNGIKKNNLRKLGIETIEIDVKSLVKMFNSKELQNNDFHIRDQIKDFIINGRDRKIVYDKRIDDAEKRYHDSLFLTNGERFGCPLTNYNVSVTRKECRSCFCYLGVEGGIQRCTGKGCYTKPSQIIDANSKYEDRLDTVLIPQDESGEFKLTHKVCPKCGRILKVGVGLRGNTFNGALIKVNKDTNFMYLTCVNDFCDAEPQVLMCPNDEKIVPVYIRNKDDSIVMDKNGNPLIKHKSKYNEKIDKDLPITLEEEKEMRVYEPCDGYAKALIKNGDGFNGIVRHHKGACFIGCSDSESDKNNLPYGQEVSCDASVTIFDDEDSMIKGKWSKEILALDGLDMYFDNYKKAKKILKTIRGI